LLLKAEHCEYCPREKRPLATVKTAAREVTGSGPVFDREYKLVDAWLKNKDVPENLVQPARGAVTHVEQELELYRTGRTNKASEEESHGCTTKHSSILKGRISLGAQRIREFRTVTRQRRGYGFHSLETDELSCHGRRTQIRTD
jgi:hypothetical protein